MSSILDALKKAEQESTADHYSPTPWPAPAPAPLTGRDSTRRWWVLFGLLVASGVGAAIVWQIRQPGTREPAVSSITRPPLIAQNTNPDAPPPSIKQRPTATTGGQAAPQRTESAPDQSVHAPPRTAISHTAPKMPASPRTMETVRRQPHDAKPVPVAVPADPPRHRPAPRTESAPKAVAKPPESAKTFKSDPRIELQALVWASEASERFVVINNRLVKEGGSVDNIVVVQINRDDVLLSEGSNQWHEKFKIH